MANTTSSEDDDDVPMDSEPVCLLCGAEMELMGRYAVTNTDFPRVALEEEQWKKHMRPLRSYVFVPSSEVENAYFYKYPRLWATACRASKLDSVNISSLL